MDDETHRVLWHTPTEYDPLRHGPPYLPGLPYEPVKLSSVQKADVQAFVKQAAADAVPGRAVHPDQSPLTGLLAFLQALSLLHQTHHWSTRGVAYYADHLLFERLYNESQEFIDQLAERAVGLGTPASIAALHQARRILEILESWGVSTTPQEMIEASLKAETLLLNQINTVIENLETYSSLSYGTSNLLEGLADKHESFVYLLRQRAQVGGDYTYDRG